MRSKHTVHSPDDDTQMLKQIKMCAMYNTIFIFTQILLKLYLLSVIIITCFVYLTAFQCQITLWQHGVLDAIFFSSITETIGVRVECQSG